MPHPLSFGMGHQSVSLVLCPVYANVRRTAGHVRQISKMSDKKSVFVCHNVRWKFPIIGHFLLWIMG